MVIWNAEMQHHNLSARSCHLNNMVLIYLNDGVPFAKRVIYLWQGR